MGTTLYAEPACLAVLAAQHFLQNKARVPPAWRVCHPSMSAGGQARLLRRRRVSASIAAARAPARSTTASGISAMRATFNPAPPRACTASVAGQPVCGSARVGTSTHRLPACNPTVCAACWPAPPRACATSSLVDCHGMDLAHTAFPGSILPLFAPFVGLPSLGQARALG